MELVEAIDQGPDGVDRQKSRDIVPYLKRQAYYQTLSLTSGPGRSSFGNIL
jgi:hypothetical protein